MKVFGTYSKIFGSYPEDHVTAAVSLGSKGVNRLILSICPHVDLQPFRENPSEKCFRSPAEVCLGFLEEADKSRWQGSFITLLSPMATAMGWRRDAQEDGLGKALETPQAPLACDGEACCKNIWKKMFPKKGA